MSLNVQLINEMHKKIQALLKKQKYVVKVKPIFAWYDIWVGFFWDSKKRNLYFFPLPMLGFVAAFRTKEEYDIIKVERQQPKPEETAMKIASLIHTKFKNWVTPEEVWDKFKKELNNVDYTASILQTLVFHKLAIVKQEPRSRARFKITLNDEVRLMEIRETAATYETVLVNLRNEESQLLKKKK